MLRYKLIKVTPPTDGETTVSALNVPEGQTYALKMIILDGGTTDLVTIVINETDIVQVMDNTTIGYGGGIPLDMTIKGAEEINIRVADKTGSGTAVNLIIAYEIK